MTRGTFLAMATLRSLSKAGLPDSFTAGTGACCARAEAGASMPATAAAQSTETANLIILQ